LRQLKEIAMKNRALIIAITITVLAAVSPVPRANAEPLTILAIIGLATVASISTVDIVASHDEDTRDFRAQHENAAPLSARDVTAGPTPTPDKIEVAAR
jgi:hypothetical protein